MRILMLADFYPPHIGGAEIHVQTLARELVRRGHHVAIATQPHHDAPAYEDDGGVLVYRVAGWNRVLAPFYQDQAQQFHPPAPDPGIVAALRRVVEKERPDVVHAHGWIVHSFLPLKKWSGAKLVMTLHDYGLICAKKTLFRDDQLCEGPEYRKCLRCSSAHCGRAKAVLLTSALKMNGPLHRSVDRCLAVSSAVRDALLDGTGRPGLPVEVVPNFIPGRVLDDVADRPAALPAEDNYILYVGRSSREKGVETLLDAYAGLADLAPLVMMVSAYGDTLSEIPSGVTVMRSVPHAQVMAGWQHCAVGVVPSLWPDPCPTVAMEAMICGKPLVASNVGGLRDIVADNETGLLVPPGNADILQRGLRDLLLNPARRATMGAKSRQRVQSFMVGKVADRIEQIYEEVQNRDPQPKDHVYVK